MNRVLAIGLDDRLLQLLAEASRGELTVLPVDVLLTRAIAPVLQAGVPQVVVLGTGVPLTESLALAQHLETAAPATSTVVVGPADPDIWMAAMRAGVRDVLAPEATGGEVATVLQRAADRAAVLGALTRSGGRTDEHRLVVVASPKGGVGKTTVSTNLAVGLATAGADSTVLVDLDVQFGDVASALALVPEYTLPDAVHGSATNDPLVLKTFLTRHPTGLYVVAGSESPAAGDAVTAEQVGRLLSTLRAEFRHVVVDTAPGLSDHTLTALEHATDLVLMSSMDVPGVRGLRKELDVLRELDLLPAGRHLLLNGADPAGALALEDVEATLGLGLDLVLPRSKAVPLSTNTGTPLLQEGSRDPVARGLQNLVQRLLPPAEPRSRRFGRLRTGTR